MKKEQISELSDQELLEALEANKPSPWIDAFIGFLMGVIIYSVAANTWGFIIVIPLIMIYAFLKKPKQYAALQDEMKRRNKVD